MIEIKSRYDGRVLYVAKNARDVREAVREAVSSRADLSGADLSRAYLSRADLSGADLSGAYLSRADLSRADLSGADLSGAYLSRADLSGAYLSGADLSGAYLSRADLSRADLSGAIWKQVAEALETSLQAMNDGGRHWIKGNLTKSLEDGSTAYCSLGSVRAHSEGTVSAIALWLLISATAGSIESFNDYSGTTWEDIQAVFGVAIKNARRFAKEIA